MSDEPASIPLDYIEVDGVRISGNSILANDLYHDIAQGTLTVTFAGVTDVRTVYKHASTPVRPLPNKRPDLDLLRAIQTLQERGGVRVMKDGDLYEIRVTAVRDPHQVLITLEDVRLLATMDSLE
jgi:hypothetical protein